MGGIRGEGGGDRGGKKGLRAEAAVGQSGAVQGFSIKKASDIFCGAISPWSAHVRQPARVSASASVPLDAWEFLGLRFRSGRNLWQQQALKRNMTRYASSLPWAKSADTCSMTK